MSSRTPTHPRYRALTHGVVGVSADCRLEAQYCMQQGVEMVPLLMEKGYRPTGCKFCYCLHSTVRKRGAN